MMLMDTDGMIMWVDDGWINMDRGIGSYCGR